MANNSTLTATLIGESSSLVGAFADAVRAGQKMGLSAEEINKKIADSDLAVEMAKKSRLTASQQLTFAMQYEAAKGDDLGQKLVLLEREYAALVKQMRVMAQYGQAIPESMIQQANAARKAADDIRKHKDEAEKLNNTFERFKATGIATKAFSLAVDAAGEAVKVWVKHIMDGVVPLEDLGREATTTEKSLASMKRVMADPEFEKQKWYTQALAVAYAALNTELTEAAARVEERRRKTASAELTQKGLNAAIDEQAEKDKNAAANGQRVADQLAAMRKKSHEEDTKRLKKRREIERENAEASLEIAAEYNQRILKETQDTEDEIARIKKKQRDANMEWTEFWAKSDERHEKERADRAKDALAASKKIEEGKQQAVYATTSAITSAATTAGEAWARGEMKGAQAGKTAIRDMARSAIVAASSEGAAKSIAAYSGIPFVGVAIGLGVAATVASMILAYLTKFHTGGTVRSSDGVRLPGQAPNERTITALVGERYIAPGQSAGGGGNVINLNSYSPFSPTNAESKRQARNVERAIKELRRMKMA